MSDKMDVLAVPICIGRQERQRTDPRLTCYETNIHFGSPENYGNCVAVVYGNNSTDAAEQLDFAAKLVRAYNRESAVAELVEAASNYYTRYCQDEAAEDGPEFTGCSFDQHFDAARLRDALARFKGA